MAVRISGVNIKDDKPVFISLTGIYGIGQPTAKKICKKLSIDETKRVKNLTTDEIVALLKEVKNYTIEGDLRQKVLRNIAILKEINCYRGIRHKKGLPVRGQRTKTNARTNRGGKRKTVANKKEAKQQG